MGKRDMEEIIQARRKLREKVINILEGLIQEIRDIWGKVTVVLIGSYARGDFNEWSDIDVLIVVRSEDPNPMKRYDKIIPIIMKTKLPIEPIIITKTEFKHGLKKQNPLIIEAIKAGIVIVDDLNIIKTSFTKDQEKESKND